MSTQQNASTQQAPSLTVIPLMLMTAALFLTLRNMPAMAETGLQMVFFNILTVFAFLLPIALVSAELATGWPQNGVFHWVEAAFGTKTGFVAVWLQWIQSIFGMTSILAYVSGTLAYLVNPELGNNRFFVAGSIIVLYWLATWLNAHGTKRSGQISSIALSVGVLFPTVLLILGGLYYALKGNPIHMGLSLDTNNLLPSLGQAGVWMLFLNFVFGFAGIEVSASHANEVKNPQRDYPRALFAAAFIGFILTLLGAFAIGFIIPLDKINTVNGAIQAFSIVLKEYHLSWLVPVLAFLIAMGAAGQVSTWVIGPVKGLFAAAQAGVLPQSLAKTNKVGVPMKMLIIQAICISAVGALFLLTPDVNTLFLVLTSIAVILYCMMYLLMFAAAVRLRYTHPEVHRAYRVPGGNMSMWTVSGVGGACALACFIIGFIPPSPLLMSQTLYFSLLIGGVLICAVLPLLLYRKPKTK